MNPVFYRTSVSVFRSLARLLTRLHVTGLEHEPAQGGCLLVANHISHADPMLLSAFLRRPVGWMGDLSFFQWPGAAPVLQAWGAFPIDRTKVDRSAIRTTLKRLRAGEMVGIFPERGIRHGKGSVLFETELPPGTASLIESAGCAVWPAVILGSDQLYAWRAWYRRPRIFVSYGPVLPPGEGDWNHRMKVAFQSLREEIDQRYNLTTDELPVSAQERWGLKN